MLIRQISPRAQGVSVRPAHYRALHEQSPPFDYVELRTEHFLGDGQRPRRHLRRITARYPVVLHGESLNLLGHAPLDEPHLDAIARLADEVDAAFVSDHRCWTAADGVAHHARLPAPYSEELAALAAERAAHVQRRLGRPFGLANVTSYVEFVDSTLTEWEFYRRVVEDADCGYVLDLTSVYASAMNHQFAAASYLTAIDFARVLEVQLSGHARAPQGLVVNDRDRPVGEEVLHLHAEAWQRGGPFPTMVEPALELATAFLPLPARIQRVA